MSGVTKKYRCRYFEEDGRPIHPTCNQGDSCRFVHPNDSNWPGLKPFVDTRLLKSSSASKRNKEGRRVAGSSEGRGPALVSQSDLFLRCKVEVDDPRTDPQAGRLPQKEHDRDRDRDRIRAHDARDAGGYKSYSKNRSVSPARPNVKKYARTGSDSSRRSDFATNKNKNKGPLKQDSDPVDNDSGRRSEAANANIIPNAKGSANPRPDFPSSITQTAKWIGPAKMQATASLEATAPLQVTDEGKCAERLVDLFRRLARLSNQVMQETAAHEKEGKKLQTYTEISSALSKISSSAATSVAPTLADIMLKHEQSKHRAEESLKALGGAWEQVFDVFVTEIAHVIDARLQDAMTKLKTEGESTIIEIMANAPGPRTTNGSASYDRKRARTRGPAEKENEESRSGRGASRDRDHKRRRLASRSSSPASHERSGRPNDDTSIEEILTQMKHKIDQQARSLQQLTKENSELKTNLKQTTVPSSCSSFSLSSTPQESRVSGPRSAQSTPTKPRLSLNYFRTA